MNNITFEMLQKANESIKTTDIKGKDYAEVNQRIKAFRMVYPQGSIVTNMVSNHNGTCVFEARIYSEPDKKDLLATGTAYEKEGSTFINKTSYIENCETSAIGRALGIAGFGIDTSIASAEEVKNAIANQQEKKKLIKPATPEQLKILSKVFSEPDELDKLLTKHKIKKLEELPLEVASAYIKKINQKKEKKENGIE